MRNECHETEEREEEIEITIDFELPYDPSLEGVLNHMLSDEEIKEMEKELEQDFPF